MESETTDRKAWRCAPCFCCHIRTGTIIFGILNLMLHVLALSIIAVVLMHPELIGQQGDDQPAQLTLDGDAESISETQLCDYQSEYTLLKDRRWTPQDVYIGLAATLFSLSVSLLMVYGAIKGMPMYLLPFFCLQVFGFCVACVTMLGSLSAVGDIREVMTSWSTLPYPNSSVVQVDPQWLGLILLITFILAMVFKAYVIYVVWCCYKYLVKAKKEKTGLVVLGESDSQMLLPPDYETATKDSSFVPAYSTPPPPYSPQQQQQQQQEA